MWGGEGLNGGLKPPFSNAMSPIWFFAATPKIDICACAYKKWNKGQGAGSHLGLASSAISLSWLLEKQHFAVTESV